MRTRLYKAIAVAAVTAAAAAGVIAAAPGTAHAMTVCDCGGGTWYGTFATPEQALQFEQQVLIWQMGYREDQIIIERINNVLWDLANE